jgi:hypothetical protein
MGGGSGNGSLPWDTQSPPHIHTATQEKALGRKAVQPDEDKKAMELLIQGHSLNSASIATGISRHRVTVLNKKHRDLIQTAHANLIEQGLAKAISRTVSEIDMAGHLQKVLKGEAENNTTLESVHDINEYLKRVDKKEEMLLKSVGISPSISPSIHVQNIFNDNRTTTLSPVVSALISGRLDELMADEDDADYEEI